MTWMRVLTAVVLIPVVVGIAWWGSTALVAALTGVVTVLALLEFFALGEKIGMRGYRVWTCICAVIILLAQWALAGVMYGLWIGSLRVLFVTQFSAGLAFLVFALGASVIVLGSRLPLTAALPSLAISAAALLFIALPLSYLALLHGVTGVGRQLLLFVLVLIWVGDTAAYFVGRSIGRHLMAPQLSPKKTWEGAAANVIGSLVVGAVFARWMALPLSGMLGAAAAGSVAGQVGDLLESAYKRSAGAKDSGMLLPGHGGMLDRIDALILAAPVVWYYWVFLLSGR
jgi:phosphatidate cytidylyltransferase